MRLGQSFPGFLVIVNVLALLVQAGCADTATESPESADTTTARAAPAGVEVVDFGYDMPEEVAGPFIDLEITNTGEFAHELGLELIEPGTTAKDIQTGPQEDPPWLISNPAGISLLTAGQTVRYQRELEPGTYAFVCHFPMADGTNHLDAGMVKVFEVIDARSTEEPEADATITVTDKAIELPELQAGTQTIQFVNGGTRVHELGISGVPPETAEGDLAKLGQQIGQWFGEGQPGPPPGGLVGPGGHQTIEPGESVWLTVTLEEGFLYRFDDSSGKKPLEAFATIE